MSDYKYRDLTKEGYVKVKFSKAEHKKWFPNRKLSIWKKHEYYYLKDRMFRIEFYDSVLAVVVSIILFIPNLFIHGIANIKEIIKDYKGLIWQKKYGSFYSDTVWLKDDTEYRIELKNLLNKKVEKLEKEIETLKGKEEL